MQDDAEGTRGLEQGALGVVPIVILVLAAATPLGAVVGTMALVDCSALPKCGFSPLATRY